MFERFSSHARQVVVLAQQEGRTLHHSRIGTEHLLLGLLAEGEGVAAVTLAEAGLTLEAARAETVRLLSGDPAGDAEALKVIGIDLDAVRATVEETFGPGALERAQDCDHRGRRRGRGRGQNRVGGHIPFTPRAKQVLELSLREALRLGHNSIGTEHVLLGLLREGRGLGVKVLTERGIDVATLRQRVVAAAGKVA